MEKTALVYKGRTLLERAVRAAAAARAVVIVGPTTAAGAFGRSRVIFAREQPLFGGPVAGVATGLRALTETQATPCDAVVVLAGDLARPEEAVAELLAGVRPFGSGEAASDGYVAIDEDGHWQHLLACYRTDSLARALASVSEDGRGESMRMLTAGLRLGRVVVGAGLAADVDTWDDVTRLGVTGPTSDLLVEEIRKPGQRRCAGSRSGDPGATRTGVVVGGQGGELVADRWAGEDMEQGLNLGRGDMALGNGQE